MFCAPKPKMHIKLHKNAQAHFENLQLIAPGQTLCSDMVSSDFWEPHVMTRSIGGGPCFCQCEEPTHQAQTTTNDELAKLLDMASSMHLTVQLPKTKHVATSSIEINLPAPVRFTRANRKAAVNK
jgi:hypothetical protein